MRLFMVSMVLLVAGCMRWSPCIGWVPVATEARVAANLLSDESVPPGAPRQGIGFPVDIRHGRQRMNIRLQLRDLSKITWDADTPSYDALTGRFAISVWRQRAGDIRRVDTIWVTQVMQNIGYPVRQELFETGDTLIVEWALPIMVERREGDFRVVTAIRSVIDNTSNDPATDYGVWIEEFQPTGVQQ